MIGGNTQGQIQVCTTAKNAIGAGVKTWITIQTLNGFLDFQSGDSKYSIYHTKMQETSHIFISDYEQLDSRIKAENSRMIINGAVYDIMLVDDPMGLHKQLEIYLKYTGGQ